MKDFDLQAAKNGAPVCTRDGRKARIVCYDVKITIGHFPFLVLIENDGIEQGFAYNEQGHRPYTDGDNDPNDLMMATEEDEDEKIRQAIKQMYSFLPNKPEYIGSVAWQDILAWLEKQEKKCNNHLELSDEETKKFREDWYNAGLKRGLEMQKTKWSGEDDYNLQCMIAKATSDIQKGNVGRNNELIDWLKSLKQRMEE